MKPTCRARGLDDREFDPADLSVLAPELESVARGHALVRLARQGPLPGGLAEIGVYNVSEVCAFAIGDVSGAGVDFLLRHDRMGRPGQPFPTERYALSKSSPS